MAKIETQCFILHSRPFKETSLLLSIFSPLNGRFSLIAKGVKRKNAQNLRAVLQSFSLLNIEYTGKSNLKTLCQAEIVDRQKALPSRALACGYYLNELILRAIEEWQEFPTLFESYRKTIFLLKGTQATEATGLAPLLRNFEVALLTELGVAPDWTLDTGGNNINPDSYYEFIKDSGFQLIDDSSLSQIGNNRLAYIRKGFIGRAIISLANNQYDIQSMKISQQITQMLLRQIIGDKPLESRKLWI